MNLQSNLAGRRDHPTGVGNIFTRWVKRSARALLIVGATVLLGGCQLADLWGGRNIEPANLTKDHVLIAINNIIGFLAAFGGAVTIFIMVAAFQYMLSAGSDEGITRAKTTIRYAAVGMVFIVAAYAIVRLVFQLFANDAAIDRVFS